MARYSLIIEDKVYLAVLKLAEGQGLTVGKWLNELIKDAVRNNRVIVAKCNCGKDALYKVITKGKYMYFFCEQHYDPKRYRERDDVEVYWADPTKTEKLPEPGFYRG